MVLEAGLIDFLGKITRFDFSSKEIIFSDFLY
jgi:hypothetical protein